MKATTKKTPSRDALDRAKVRAVACPKCGAKAGPGGGCVGPTGKPLGRFHDERVRLAEGGGDAVETNAFGERVSEKQRKAFDAACPGFEAPPAAPAPAARCAATIPLVEKGMRGRCDLPAGHKGHHSINGTRFAGKVGKREQEAANKADRKAFLEVVGPLLANPAPVPLAGSRADLQRRVEAGEVTCSRPSCRFHASVLVGDEALCRTHAAEATKPAGVCPSAKTKLLGRLEALLVEVEALSDSLEDQDVPTVAAEVLQARQALLAAKSAAGKLGETWIPAGSPVKLLPDVAADYAAIVLDSPLRLERYLGSDHLAEVAVLNPAHPRTITVPVRFLSPA